MPKTLNAITHDDYIRAEGAKMMLRALQDFVRMWRSTDSKGMPTKEGISVISRKYNHQLPVSDENNPYCEIPRISTDMIIEGVQRLTANTFSCVDFIYGQFPKYASLKEHKTNTKCGYKIDSIDFIYRKEK